MGDERGHGPPQAITQRTVKYLVHRVLEEAFISTEVQVKGQHNFKMDTKQVKS